MSNYYGRTLHVEPALKLKNRTIIEAMNREKPIYYKVENRKNFVECLEELFKKLSESNLNNVVFVMDNATFHHCHEIKTLIAIL